MAKTLLGTHPKVGDLCYKPFTILRPGKIIGVASQQNSDSSYDIEVKWLDGVITTENSWNLNDFNHAVDEHLKKYNKLDAFRVKLNKL